MAKKQLNVKIITPERVIFEDTADAVYSKSVNGEFGILPEHISYMTSLGIGVARIEKDKKIEYAAIIGGVFQVSKDNVIILSDVAELGENIDITRANAAKERAEARLRKAEKDVDVDRAQLALVKALIRIKAASKSGFGS